MEFTKRYIGRASKAADKKYIDDVCDHGIGDLDGDFRSKPIWSGTGLWLGYPVGERDIERSRLEKMVLGFCPGIFGKGASNNSGVPGRPIDCTNLVFVEVI